MNHNQIIRKIKNHSISVLILCKAFIFGQKDSKFKFCLKLCCLTSFFISLIIVVIDSVVSGMHREIITSIKETNADAKIILHQPHYSYDSKKVVSKIKSKIGNYVKSLIPIGTHTLFMSMNGEIVPVTLLVANNFEPFKKHIKNFKKNGSKNGLYIDRLLAINFGIVEPKNITLMFPHKYSGRKSSIICKSKQILCTGTLSSNTDDSYKNILMNSKEFEIITKNKANTQILVSVKEALTDDVKKNMKKTISPNFGELLFWEDSYPDLYETIVLEKKCSDIICIALEIVCIIVICSLLGVLFSSRASTYYTLILHGISKTHLFIVELISTAIPIGIASFVGSLIGYTLTYLLDKYKLIKIACVTCDLPIPFMPEKRILLLLFVINTIFSVITVLLFIKRIEKSLLR
jgi:ABC-type lipoprotein release transport system permease subunit